MAVHARVVMMIGRITTVFLAIVASICLLLGCASSDKWFDTDTETNPHVRRANFEDKINAFKLYIPPGTWRVVGDEVALLALENRECIGKLTVSASWSLGSDPVNLAREGVEFTIDDEPEWVSSRVFLVRDFPAAIVAGEGRVLYSAAEEFYVRRTVAVGVIKFGSRLCLLKYVAPRNCFEQTEDDLIALMNSFERIERF